MKLLTFAFFILLPMISMAEVWPTQNNWNEDWETKYSKWVGEKMNSDFFTTATSPYYNISMNCADFIYVARIIFAFENNLEFAMNQSAQSTFSSRTNQFDQISDPMLRLKKFIEKATTIGDIRTLARDSFLVPIKSIRPGDFLLASPVRIHSWLIWKINEFANPTLLYATEPPGALLYESYGYPSTSDFFEAANGASVAGAGIRRFRWPSELHLEHSKIARATLEQLSYGKTNFFEDIQKDVTHRPANVSDEIRQAIDNACVLAQVRVNAVNWALLQLRLRGGRPFQKGDEYDSQSTDHRDLELKSAFQEIDRIYSEHATDLTELALKFYKAAIDKSQTNPSQKFCRIDWAENRQEALGVIRDKSLAGRLSPNPNDSLALRWERP